MTPTRFVSAMASVLVTLAVALPATAQGHGNGRGKPVAPPPTSTSVPAAAAGTVPTATAPFAWMDDANLLQARTVWLGVSMVQWHGGGASQVVVPVFDGSIGLSPRVQVGVSVPRVEGGVGTTFYSAKLGVVNDEARGLKLAVGPTLEVLSQATMQWEPPGRSRVQWGIPVSVELDRQVGRVYGSSGYFSPGIWYAGAGIGWSPTDHLSASMSYSRAWTTLATPGSSAIAGPHRNDLSGGASIDITPNIAVFGSVGRTIATAADNGAGTTVSFGLSLSAGPVVFKK